MQITFADGTTAPVEQLHWSPAFTVGIAQRADGFKRCVFIGRDGQLAYRDPWILRLEPAPKPKLECVA